MQGREPYSPYGEEQTLSSSVTESNRQPVGKVVTLRTTVADSQIKCEPREWYPDAAISKIRHRVPFPSVNSRPLTRAWSIHPALSPLMSVVAEND